MRYEFYYKIKNEKEHISYTFYDDDGGIKTDIIGSTEKLIDFIKRHCLNTCDVYFVNFESNAIISILNGICTDIEYVFPPIGEEGPYQMYKRISKVRGK